MHFFCNVAIFKSHMNQQRKQFYCLNEYWMISCATVEINTFILISDNAVWCTVCFFFNFVYYFSYILALYILILFLKSNISIIFSTIPNVNCRYNTILKGKKNKLGGGRESPLQYSISPRFMHTSIHHLFIWTMDTFY